MIRWSVSLVAEGDRLVTHEEIVELADAVAASNGIASGIGTATYGAQIVVEAPTMDDAVELAVTVFRAAAARAGLPPWPVARAEAVGDDDVDDWTVDDPTIDDPDGGPMIRLGSLAGYPFEGPRALAGWTAPARPGVYAILCKPEPDAKPEQYAVIYVDHADDLSAERFPFQHRRASSWVQRAGNRYRLYICTYEVPGGLPSHREQIARELTAIYRPSCNTEQYDSAWKDEWIGEYSAPTAGPLTTGRDPSPPPI